MAASACHGSREAIIFGNRLLCLFIYLFLIYFLIFQSWISETAAWGQLCRTFAASRVGGWNRTSLSQSPKLPLGELRSNVGRRLDRHHPTALALPRGGHHGMPPWAYYVELIIISRPKLIKYDIYGAACSLPTFSIENHSHTNKVQYSQQQQHASWARSRLYGQLWVLVINKAKDRDQG